MGYPLRFFGADEPVENDNFVLPPNCGVEVTFRTHQQQFLHRPDAETNKIILGCFGRAYARTPDLQLVAVSFLSNHGCMLALPKSPAALSNFMRDFASTTAIKLNELRDRTGTFWERRYRAIPIVDEAKLEDRFRYVLTQGTKENLIDSAKDWPGVSSVCTLLTGKPLSGWWRDRGREYELKRQRSRKLDRATARGDKRHLPRVRQVWLQYGIEHVPLPHWAHLKVGQRRQRIAHIINQDAKKTQQRHQREGTSPLGVRGVLTTSPSARPRAPKKSPAPLCHASTKKGRNAFRAAYRQYVDSVRTGIAKLKGVLATHLWCPRGASTGPLVSTEVGTPPREPLFVKVVLDGEHFDPYGPAPTRRARS